MVPTGGSSGSASEILRRVDADILRDAHIEGAHAPMEGAGHIEHDILPPSRRGGLFELQLFLGR